MLYVARCFPRCWARDVRHLCPSDHSRRVDDVAKPPSGRNFYCQGWPLAQRGPTDRLVTSCDNDQKRNRFCRFVRCAMTSQQWEELRATHHRNPATAIMRGANTGLRVRPRVQRNLARIAAEACKKPRQDTRRNVSYQARGGGNGTQTNISKRSTVIGILFGFAVPMTVIAALFMA